MARILKQLPTAHFLFLFFKIELIDKKTLLKVSSVWKIPLAGFFFSCLGNVTKSFRIDVHLVRDVDRGTRPVRADFISGCQTPGRQTV